MTQSFSLSVGHHLVGHGSLTDINGAVEALQKLTGADDRYLAGDYGRVVHETETGCVQFKVESCDVLTHSQMEDADEAAKQIEAEKTGV